MKLLVATTNPGKVKEFREILSTAAGSTLQWDDLSAHADLPAPEETGLTFRANAMLKAAYYAAALKTWALADDSGLQVAALNDAPGVHSARWAQRHNAGKGDQANNALLISQLSAIAGGGDWPHFPARFACCLALADPLGRIIFTTRGAVAGSIIRQPRGGNGFGYDPLFLIDSLGKTTAELSPDQKHAISHRGQALARMRTLLQSLPDHLTRTPPG